ncbi:unnamed protein product, partial [marine sediment metagenome]
AIGPWNVETEHWMQYFVSVLHELNPNTEYGMQLDGIALHTYAIGCDPAGVTANSYMDPPHEHWRYGFRTYMDFMEVIPHWARHLPVYVTETNQNGPWENRNTGWVQAAYAEIDRWNRVAGVQPIRCLTLYRWEEYDRWHIKGKSGVIDDLKLARAQGYQWRTRPPDPDPIVPEPLPNDETATDAVTLAEKTRWWLEELIRQIEAGHEARARAIRYSLVDLMYRLERAVKTREVESEH